MFNWYKMSYMDDFRHLEIQLDDIKVATNDFSDTPIGSGGFGAVYKGELFLPKGRRTVAFKRLNRKFGQGDVEFWKEITMLSELSHDNLASLLHFCREGDERILVYEYASRQSLDRYLDKASLTWTQRLNICLGAAKGIAYLHDPKKTQQRVLHRDIKSSNILLDDKWTAKVSDFGLSKIAPANQPRTYLVSNIVGTPGYCDPTYYETGILSKECDVYSFGVVLFEVMCGRLCCEFDKDKLECILVHIWKNRCDEDRLDDIIFPGLKQQINPESLSTFVAIAKRCLDRDHKERPKMVEVVKELEAALHKQQDSKQNKASLAKTQTSYRFMKKFDHLKIPLTYILSATNNFSIDNLCEHSGFGQVYKGKLSLPGGQHMVCFKRFDPRLGGGSVEFWKEISLLSKYKHENLVSLLNFCNEDDEMILVYNYAYHRSLKKYLSDPSLTWTQRLKICVGVAHAINYLHDPQDRKQIVLHGDIKSSNIVVSEDWTARISNFGQSVFVPVYQRRTHVSSTVVTAGYCDPLYRETGILTNKSDVYSFGVVLFEVMCGTLCTDYHERRLTLLVPKWIRYYNEDRLAQIIFPVLKDNMDPCSLKTFSAIAYRCLKKASEERPTMAEVMKELEIALEQQEDFEEKLRIENLMISSMINTTKDINFMLFPKGVLVGDGNTWLSKLENGSICEVISATKCIYADSLGHDNTQNSRFSNVITGGMYNGFTVKVRSQFLSLKTTYAVSLVFQHNNGTDHGTHMPFKFKLDEQTNYFNSCMAHVRDDGWLMIELCQFTSYKREHDLDIHFLPLFNITSSSIQYFLEGIEFRPVQYIS